MYLCDYSTIASRDKKTWIDEPTRLVNDRVNRGQELNQFINLYDYSSTESIDKYTWKCDPTRLFNGRE